MANRKTKLMDVREIIHRLRAGNSKRQHPRGSRRELQVNWRTVKKYAS